MTIFLVILLTLLALCGAIAFWVCLVVLIIEWECMDGLERIAYILATIAGATSVVTCSYIMAFCL